MTNGNPLLNPYKVPPLDILQTEHFEPAIDHAIEEAQKKLAALKQDTSPPTFDNLVVPLDQITHDIERIVSVMGTFRGSQFSDALIDAAESIDQKISAFEKTIFQDKELAARFKAVASPSADEDITLYSDLSDSFESDGAFLSTKEQQRIKAIDKRLISLTSKFTNNLDKGTEQQAVFFTDEEDIAGLPEATVSGLRTAAQKAGHDTGWLVKPERLLVDKLLESAESRNFRQKIFEALARVGTQPPYDNEPIIKEIQSLRHERAKTIGYSDHAAYALSQTMAGSLPRANELMDAVAKKALPKFENSMRLIQAFSVANDGPRTLEPWDVAYWANRYKEKTFGFDANTFSEYLPLEGVIDGFFKTAERIFDITFQENKTYPSYHADVRTYDVTDNKTGESLGILYADFFERKKKEGGAWMLQMQQKMPGHPNIVTLNMNLLKPEEGKPTLLSLEDFSTLFHEGGHALHGLLGTKTAHPSLQGTDGSSDYIEFFSTIMENWANQKEVLDSFARHYQTGAPLPDDLFRAMKDCQTFLSERTTLKVIQNARRDFAFHTMDPKDYTTSKALEKSADFQHPLVDAIGSYPLNRWSHLFSDALSGYAAGYYGYLWSQGLAALGFQLFEEKGMFNPEACQRLAKMYSYGVSRDMQRAYEEYLGKPLSIDTMANALLKSIGADKPARVLSFGSKAAAVD